jgi:hypothetical protein
MIFQTVEQASHRHTPYAHPKIGRVKEV